MNKPLVDIPDKPTDKPKDAPPAPTPGNDRPVWLPEKFKDGEALAKSYGELEKKLGSMSRAPEKYDLKLPEGVKLDQAVLDKFKVSALTNEQAQAVVDFYVNDLLPGFTAVQRELEQQRFAQATGLSLEAGNAEIQRVLEWAKSQKNGEELLQAHQSTASGVQFLREKMLRELDSQRITPPTIGNPKQFGKAAMSTGEVERLLADPRYTTDGAYKSMVLEKINAAMREEEAALAAV